MASTDINKATIWEDGDVTEMARFQVNGINGVQADLSTITRTIYERSSSTPDTALSTDAITISTSVFDTLQTDARWTKDSTGYNFRDRIPGAKFPTGAATYRVEYAFVGSSDEKMFIVFEHFANAISGS